MANPLDIVTQPDDDTDLSSLPRIVVRPDSVPAGDNGVGVPSVPKVPDLIPTDNQLTQSVQPSNDFDLMQGLAMLADYVKNGQFSPGTKIGNRLFGTGGEERYQTWPERMIRSGFSLPGDVLSGAEPIIDPTTGRTSERVIERAQDTAGLMGGGALTERPGVASLGSGPVRSPRLRDMAAQDEWNKLSPQEQALRRDQELQQQGAYDYNNIKTEAEADAAFENGHLTDDQYEAVLGKLVRQNRGQKLNSDTSKPGAAIAAAASSGPAPVFYSALEHVASNAAQDTMSPQQWIGYLKNQPGVKAEELAWTGLPDWLSQQKDKVSKEDVQSYLDEHKVELKDVTKKGDKEPGRSTVRLRRRTLGPIPPSS